MPAYAYEAIDASGASVRGQRPAADRSALIRDLRADGLFVTSVEDRRRHAGIPRGGWAPWTWWAAWRPLGQNDIAFFFRQFALMLRAGLSVVEALKTTERLSANRQLAALCADLAEQVESGLPFSQAMARHPARFDILVRALVATGEVTGELDALSEQIVELIQRRLEIRAQIITSMIYPGIVLLMAAGVTTFLVVKVIPQFAKFFANKAKALPPATQALLDVSAFLASYGLWIIGGGIVLLIAFVTLRWWHRTRYAVDRGVLLIPVLGAIFTSGGVSLIGNNLALLVKSGVGLVEALQVLGDCLGNACLQRRVEQARLSVTRGGTISEGIAGPGIPPLVPHLLGVGEKTGAVDKVCHELGTYFDGDLRLRLRRMMALFEPAVIVVIGGVVGFVYFAFFQAVFALV